MKKISLLKSLALFGAVGLTSVCVVETALLMHKNSGQPGDPQVGDAINLSVYNNYILAVNIEYDEAPSNEEIKILLKNTGIQLNTEAAHKFDNINDLDVVVEGTTKTFSVTAKTNSPDYVGNSSAIIHYATPTKTNIASVINNAIVYLDDKFEDETLTKANVLNSLKTSNPALNANQLDVTWNGTYGQEGSAIVSVKQNSPLYTGDPIGVTYNTSGAVVMTLDKNVIKQGETANPTFKYHGNTITGTDLTYSCSAPSANFSFITTTGALIYSAGSSPDFTGGAYSINASYVTGGNTYVASQIVFAQPNIQNGTLTLGNYNIKLGALNSGTATMKVNGDTKTVTSWAITGGLNATVNGEGLSFSNGIVTWNGTSVTRGGIYIITATYSGSGVKTATASAQVYVSPYLPDTIDALSTDVLTTAVGYRALFTRAGCSDTSMAFAHYRVNLSASVWAPISTATNVTGWVYADICVSGTNYQMELTSIFEPQRKWVVYATGSGNLSWTSADQRITTAELTNICAAFTASNVMMKTITVVGKLATLTFLANAVNATIDTNTSLWSVPAAFSPANPVWAVVVLGAYNNGSIPVNASFYYGSTKLAAAIPSGSYNVYFTSSWLIA